MDRIFIQRIGQGRSVVLIHGWGLNSSIWHHWIEPMQTNYEFILVDLPGHGQSQSSKNFYPEPVARELADKIVDAYAIIAWSLGGLFAICWSQLSKKIQKLVFMDSSPQFYVSEKWSFGIPGKILDDFASNLQNDCSTTVNRFITLQAKGPQYNASQIRLLRNRVQSHGQADKRALVQGLHLLQCENLRGICPKISQPCLMIQGEKDLIVPPETAQAFAKLVPNGEVAMIENGSHAPFLSHPEPCRQHVMKFLR